MSPRPDPTFAFTSLFRSHVAPVGRQALVGGIGGQRVQRQAGLLALLLARLALGFLAVALGAALGLVERDVLLGPLGAELFDVLLEPLEFLVVRGARGVARLELGQQRREIAVLGVRHCRDPRPRQRSEEHTSELQSLMRNSYAVFCL